MIKKLFFCSFAKNLEEIFLCVFFTKVMTIKIIVMKISIVFQVSDELLDFLSPLRGNCAHFRRERKKLRRKYILKYFYFIRNLILFSPTFCRKRNLKTKDFQHKWVRNIYEWEIDLFYFHFINGQNVYNVFAVVFWIILFLLSKYLSEERKRSDFLPTFRVRTLPI